MTTRPLHQQYIIYKGASNPDPAEYCPANGYELPPDPAVFCPAEGYVKDEPGTGSWILITEFYTIKNGTFTTTMTASGTDSDWAWKVGSTVYYSKNISISLDGSTQLVQLWGKLGGTITIWSLINMGISGIMNLSHDAFKTCGNFRLYSNAGLTGIVFPKSPTATLTQVQAYSCGLLETLDLSMYSTINNLNLQIHSNSGLKRLLINTAVVVTGAVSQFWVDGTGLFEVLDLSKFQSFGSVAQLRLNNAKIPNVIFSPTITGAPLYIYLNDADFTGSLDMSMFTAFRNGTILTLQGSKFTSVNFYSGATGGFSNLTLTGSTIGYTDLKKLPQLTNQNSGQYLFQNMNLSQAQVDQYLADLDTISSAGYTGRLISLTGTNAAPSAAGLVSKANLQAKAFTVNTN